MRPLSKTATVLVADARASIESLTPARAAAELGQPGVVLLDVRERDEIVRDGMIAGAVQVPRGLLEFAADPSSAAHNPMLDPDARVIVFCAAGGRAALATRTLKEMGYASVVSLEGGFSAWKSQGHPVTML